MVGGGGRDAGVMMLKVDGSLLSEITKTLQ